MEQALSESSRESVDVTVKRDARGTEYNQFLVCGSLFECPAKYLPIKPIGKGAYGVVCSARNLEANEKVAIKKITNAFDNVVDAKRTLREIKLLRHLSHENIVQIKDIIPPSNRTAFRDVYVVYELMDTDLHQIIRSPQPLSDDHCQYFLYQVLRGLKYIHSASILHRDLKPSNLLVNANCDLKICDFGLARTSSTEKEFMTEYVVTRWYRAPELLLSCSEYNSSIDVWSVGCIFAELLGRKPLFPGKDYVQQLNLITKVIGSPQESELGFITSEKAKRYIRSLPKNERVDFSKLWPHANKAAVDLIDRMLVFDPTKRITVEEALEHPYLASLHDLSDEPVCSTPTTYDFDSEALTPDVVREQVIVQDIAFFHPEVLDEVAVAR
mmetsp:Transcript_33546/g.74268  ORF Transcript_33546/g.74268 Transcript_33546/m.74268 type:complete len:384 (+) Transcript_33546:237-1388(+)|eukprot:CAMPEP_0202902568 /NCGR_PEP_ID=MMETSP1392-20130828/16928_1 /ASSEMBLY_ACC=CAM_ASM_000868 /TAXON_ID=225041 /ORGANISM="Chlamydomonas chlamydogama, Strain SAG 11-48b" /LENGTH=383 /DNA_ID=CAMNT_0049589353 /DNA_START=229 /DNA_END=1380 /DNA_ORIENTATION=-